MLCPIAVAMLRRFSSQSSFGVVSLSKVIYDGSGSLANINDVLQGFLRDPLQTYFLILSTSVKRKSGRRHSLWIFLILLVETSSISGL